MTNILVLIFAVWALIAGAINYSLTKKAVSISRTADKNRKDGSFTVPSSSSTAADVNRRKQGLISIIIATKNESRHIGRTLRHLENSTVDKSNVEIIIIDVDSSDSTIEVAKGSSGVIPVRFIRKHDTGVGGRGTALNDGYLRLSGELLLFLRADSLVPPGWDALLRKEMTDPHVLLAAFKFAIDRVSMAGKIEPVGMWMLEYYFNLRSYFLNLPSAMQGLCITSTNFDTRRFSDSIIMDDAEFVLKCRKDCLATTVDATFVKESVAGKEDSDDVKLAHEVKL